MFTEWWDEFEAEEAKPKASAGSRRGMTGGASPYTAASSTAETMSGFHPSQRAADAEVLTSRNKITSRARDLTRNNGWAAGAVAKEVDGVIGASFRPFCKPDWKALGLSKEWAKEFKQQVESMWRAEAEDPRKLLDVTRSQTIPQMFGTAYRSYLTEGEALAVLGWMPSRPTHTTLRLVDPDLLSNPKDAGDQARLRGGIVLSKQGAALAYWFRQGHANSSFSGVDQWKWKRIAREKRSGRPQVLHFFDKLRDGQTRGVSRMAPIIEKLKMEDHYSRVELQAAVINAILAAFIKSPMGPEVMDEMFGEGDAAAFKSMSADRAEHYNNMGGVSLGGARVTQLYPNDEIGMVQTARPAAQFADFEAAVLRNIASGMGISYEQLASDWSKTNYSSARAALIEIWRGWTSRRTAFAQGFCQPFYMAWLEEKVLDGHIELPEGAPDFHANWMHYARTKWVGPGRGFVDPVKEVQAAAMKVSLGLSTLEDEAAELTGSDWTDNLEQITREIEELPIGVLHPIQESFAKLLAPVLSKVDEEQ